MSRNSLNGIKHAATYVRQLGKGGLQCTKPAGSLIQYNWFDWVHVGPSTSSRVFFFFFFFLIPFSSLLMGLLPLGSCHPSPAVEAMDPQPRGDPPSSRLIYGVRYQLCGTHRFSGVSFLLAVPCTYRHLIDNSTEDYQNTGMGGKAAETLD
jgi:hypothetical protein